MSDATPTVEATPEARIEEAARLLASFDRQDRSVAATRAQIYRADALEADPSTATRAERIDRARRLLTPPDPKAAREHAIAALINEYDLPRETAEQDVQEASKGDAARFERTDLGKMMREGVPEVEFLVEPIIYDHGTHAFVGHPESGKTTFVMEMARQVMVEGRDVIWMDYEAGPVQTVERLRALGIEADMIERHFVYFYMPSTGIDEEAVAALEALWDEHPGAFGVFDSTAEALSLTSLDEDRASDVTKWMRVMNKIAKERSVAIAMIDHTTKTHRNGALYTARGSGSKLGAVDVEWEVKKVRDFNEFEVGEIHLIRHKARRGRIPKARYFEVGDGEGGLSIRPLDPDEAGTQRAIVRRRIIAHLRDAGDWCSQHRLEQEVEGSNELIRECAAALAGEADQPVEGKEGARNAKLYRYVERPGAHGEAPSNLDF